MRTIELKKKDIQFLIAHTNHEIIKSKLNKAIEKIGMKTNYPIIFSKWEIELINESLTDIFSNSGLKINDEPNTLGTYIETLIDIFNPYH